MMSTGKDYLHKLIDEIGLEEVLEIIDFVEYLKLKREKSNYLNLMKAYMINAEFWNNEIDDESWNHM